MTRSPFVKIVSRNALSKAFAQAAWFSMAFLLRKQSECLPLVRQLRHEKMDEDSAIESATVTGMENGHLEIKLHRRKHMKGGSRMVRRCIGRRYPAGSLDIQVPQLVSPVLFILRKSARGGCARRRGGF